MKTRILAVILILAFTRTLASQVLPPEEPLVPEDYDPGEFPQWAHDLRRFEIILFGSLPITFIAPSIIYDFSIFAANNFDPNFSMGTQRSNQDIAIIMITSISISAAIALADLIIGKTKARNQRRAREEAASRDEE